MNSGSVLDFGWSDTLPPPSPPLPGWEPVVWLQSCATPQSSQRMMGKSTWIQGRSSFMIPWNGRTFGVFFYLNVKIQNSQDHRDDNNKPVESNSSGSSSTWTFFGHFLSPQSLRKIHVRGRRPHRRTENCRHRYDQFGTESKGLSFKNGKKKSKHLCNLCFQLRIPAAATSPGHTRKSEFLFLHLSQF